MKLSINLFMTLDGVSQSPGSPEEDDRGGFDRGGWLMPLFDDGCAQVVNGWFSQTSALLLGRTTYDTFAAHWPHVTDPEDRVADRINRGQKYVVTSNPVGDVWQDSTTTLGDDFLERVRQLKHEPGDELQVHGSIRLARALHRAGLVDIFRFLIAPVIVGGGLSIFSDDDAASTLTLTSSSTTDSGVTAMELVPGEFQQAVATVEDGKDSVQQH
ncbi:dihydrofolate reductase family protein [uncultured Agrococcus sp.]|uniref:dihydrofolate reductase family protein n=1 Tax=uncultured Agrococcus sp. TaxID=382258 RepID=UPI0025D76642|nr:dihydrofolate reductase family protein [uncultured Agrococcus sp.]